jgi:solute carrier family 25 phosphate transporter 23/24/25/41
VHTGAYKSIWHAFGKIVHEEGMGAMYRGLLPTLIGLVPYSAAYYFLYDTLTREYRQITKKKQLDSVETLFIGAFAGTSSLEPLFNRSLS